MIAFVCPITQTLTRRMNKTQVVKAKLDKAVASFEAIDLQLKTRLKKFHSDRFEMMRPFTNLILFSQLDVLNRACVMMTDATDHLPKEAKKSTLDTLGHMHSTRGVRPKSVIPAKGGWGTSQWSSASWSTSKQTDVMSSQGNSRGGKVPQTPQIDADVMPPTPIDSGDQNQNDNNNKKERGEDDRILSGALGDEGEEQISRPSIEMNEGDEMYDEDVIAYVVADFDFASDDAGDLPFQKGNKIKVLAKGGGWWKGSLNGRIGMFPANYTSSDS